MTTIRLTPSQKRRVEGAIKVVEGYRGRRMSRGEAVAEFADFVMGKRAEFVARKDAEEPPWKDDPIFKPDFGWHFGRTDASSVDELVYGRRRR